MEQRIVRAISLSCLFLFACDGTLESGQGPASGDGGNGTQASGPSGEAAPDGGAEPDGGFSGGPSAPTGSGGAQTGGSGGTTSGGGAGSGTTGGDVLADAAADAADAGSSQDGAGQAPVDAGAPAEPKFRVYLLLGQSNMEGYPKAQPADRAEDERIRVLGYDNCASTGRVKDAWDVAAPPLHSCWNDGIGPGDYFAKTLIDVLPEGDTIGLVPCAINGERIETFLKQGGSKYDWIVQRARLAQAEGGVIDGILFHQGESNNLDPTWPGKVNSLVEDLKADLGLGDIPFLAGELLYTGGTAGHNTLVRQLPGVVENGHVVSAEGLAVDPTDGQWNLHFGHDAQVTLGTRYAEKFIEVMGW